MSPVRISRLCRLTAMWTIMMLIAPVPTTAAASARQDLETVDPNVADLGPLSTSFRDMGIDLRQPTDFDRVYRVPGMEDHFMRANGALHAVFPHSVYQRVRRRRGGSVTMPLIPGGTVFYIGPPPTDALATDGRTPSRRFADSPRQGPDATSGQAPPASPYPRKLHPSAHRPVPPARIERVEPTTIVTDPAYRAARLHELMRRAARAADDHAND